MWRQQQPVPARGGVRQPAGCMQFSRSVSLWAGLETRQHCLCLCFHLLQRLLSLFKSFHTFVFFNVTLQILLKCFQLYYSFKKIIVYALGEALWRNLAYKSCNQIHFSPWNMQLYDTSGKLLKAEFLDILCEISVERRHHSSAIGFLPQVHLFMAKIEKTLKLYCRW